MRNDRHLAIKLRKKGKSYNHISKVLEIPKSTMVYWFKNKTWSEEIKKELTRKANYIAKKRLTLINKRRQEQWEKWRESHRIEAVTEFNRLKSNPLFMAGLMLYWAEGDNNLQNSMVRISNITPNIIKIFVEFIKKICKIPDEKIKISLIIYPDLNDESCKKFWMRQTKLQKGNFYKTQVIRGKHPTKRLENGICMITAGGRGLKEKIFQWYKLSTEMLLNADMV